MSETVENFPDDLLNDVDLLREEQLWRRAVSTPGSPVVHDQEGWLGTVVELRGDPVNGGNVLIEHEMDGARVQRWYSALAFSPAMKMQSPFRRASNWLTRSAQQDEDPWERMARWRETEGDLDLEPFIENYGLTRDTQEAGYILPDGRMLNFGDPAQPGMKSKDHRDVGGGTEGMLEFMMRSGAVRWGHYNRNSATIDFINALTNQQIRAISRVIPSLEYLGVDIRNSSGQVVFHEDAHDRPAVGRLWRQIQGGGG